MKLTSSLLVLTIAGGIAPPTEAGQQGLEMDWGQKARPGLVIVQAQRHLEGTNRGLSPIILSPIILQEASIVLAQAAVPAAGVTPSPDFLFKVCKETESTSEGDPMSAMRGVNPVGMLTAYMGNYQNRFIDMDTEATIKPVLLQDTTHGKLNRHVTEEGYVYFMYAPTPDYVGNDRAVFQVEFEGKVYKIVVELHVFIAVDEHESSCPPPKLIKVKKPAKPASGVNGYDLNSITVTFADLEGSALGLTNTNGITLDTTAANYNWYIDPTPNQNEEYLPTSNPNEWVAKAGSDAAGKMDMLTVLLHEYGHALGINHSPDPNDYMGATLTAGVRRLPSAEEMVLMQGLVAQAKAALTAATLSPSPLPIPSPQSSPASGRGSEREKQSSIPAGEGANFAAFGSGSSSSSDAFEVALLNANTGASLLGGTGLTRSDAFLNL